MRTQMEALKDYLSDDNVRGERTSQLRDHVKNWGFYDLTAEDWDRWYPFFSRNFASLNMDRALEEIEAEKRRASKRKGRAVNFQDTGFKRNPTMKKFSFAVVANAKRDPNGNPRKLMQVYRVHDKFRPELIGVIEMGYFGAQQALRESGFDSESGAVVYAPGEMSVKEYRENLKYDPAVTMTQRDMRKTRAKNPAPKKKAAAKEVVTVGGFVIVFQPPKGKPLYLKSWSVINGVGAVDTMKDARHFDTKRAAELTAQEIVKSGVAAGYKVGYKAHPRTITKKR